MICILYPSDPEEVNRKLEERLKEARDKKWLQKDIEDRKKELRRLRRLRFKDSFKGFFKGLVLLINVNALVVVVILVLTFVCGIRDLSKRGRIKMEGIIDEARQEGISLGIMETRVHAVKRGLAEWKIIDEYGTVVFYWKDEGVFGIELTDVEKTSTE